MQKKFVKLSKIQLLYLFKLLLGKKIYVMSKNWNAKRSLMNLSQGDRLRIKALSRFVEYYLVKENDQIPDKQITNIPKQFPLALYSYNENVFQVYDRILLSKLFLSKHDHSVDCMHEINHFPFMV